MKLEKFDKNKKGKIIVASVVLGLFLIVGGVYLFRSHAIFEEHKTFDVIFGKVPPFKKKEKDLEIAILVDGESVSVAPTDKDYRVRVECDTDEISGEWDYTNWYANISGHVTKLVICTIIFESIYDSITVDGESRNTFPEKGDYQYNMTCSNVTNYSWNEDTWTPTVTGINKDSSCDVVFKSTNNIITKITFDGEERNSYPNKEETNSVEIKCTNGSTGEWDKENWKVKKVNNVTNETTCEVAFSSKPAIYDVVNIGDYVAYTPSRTSYEISAESTGCTSSSYCNGVTTQTINPSELNLWRVIKKNENDGTIEIISEYLSSDDVVFYGKEGYRRYVGTLNEIASAYETEGITVGSHHFGYDGEQAICSTYDACSDQKTDTKTLSEDIRNVNKAYGGNETCTSSCASLIAYKSNATTTADHYYLASRAFGTVEYGDNGKFYRGREIHINGFTHFATLTSSIYTDSGVSNPVRPIVTLKSGLTAAQLEDKRDNRQYKTFKQWKVN